MWALIENGVVVELTDTDPAGRYHPDMKWVACPAEAAVGDGYDGEAFTSGAGLPAPAATPAELAAAAIATRRYTAEVAGIQWQGYGIATDRDSQNKVDKEDRAVDKAMREDGKGWKCLDLSTGQVVFRPTSNVEMRAIAAAVYAYVSACFAREAELLAALAEGTYTDEMLAEGWPAQVAG